MRFVDTNILLYAASTVADEAAKRDSARALLDEADLALSVQVLQEFYVQATRPSRPQPLTHEQAASLIEAWMRYPVQATTSEVLLAALATRRQWGIPYWDAAIIEAARTLGCRIVYSEDLQDGMDFGGVRVVDPFH